MVHCQFSAWTQDFESESTTGAGTTTTDSTEGVVEGVTEGVALSESTENAVKVICFLIYFVFSFCVCPLLASFC